MTTFTASRPILRTRPLHQRILIRSWEYIPAVRIAVLSVRLLGALIATVGGILLLTTSNGWGAGALALAAATAAFALWVFNTAGKGWRGAGR